MATTANATDGYRLQYRIRNHDLKDPARPVEVQATPDEVRQLATRGYLVKERLLSEEQTAQLRWALDGVAAAELSLIHI